MSASFSLHSRPFRPSCRSKSAFTLVELLVVVGIIALLIAILLPSLNKARTAAQQVACKSQLRQWASAALMYTNDNRDVMPEAHRWLDYNGGLLRYLGVTATNPATATATVEKYARCPADGDSRLGTLGNYVSAGYDFQLRTKGDQVYTPRVSIGINPNMFSSLITPRWLRPRTLKASGNMDVARIMLFGDYQNHPDGNDAAAPELAAVRPMFPGVADNTKMGTIAFRHFNQCNVVYADGHVGAIAATIPLTNKGTDMLPGQSWVPNPWPAGLTSKAAVLYKHTQYYYPFGPAYEGKKINMFGDFPTVSVLN